MKTAIVCISILCVCIKNCDAQSLERQVIGSSGGFQTSTWGTLSTTVGEVMTKTSVVPTFSLTQGFQQPPDATLKLNELSIFGTLIQVFPNPATERIFVSIRSDRLAEYSASIVNVLGQILNVKSSPKAANLGYQSFYFEIESLPAASYFILITDMSGAVIKTEMFSKIN